MALTGKVSSEHVIKAPVEKWFNFFSNTLHHIPKVAERVHEANLHQGDDWHTIDSVKNWTFIIEGKHVTLKEKIVASDESNKTITWNFHDGDLGKQYKVFLLTMKLEEKHDGSGNIVKWTIDYEKVNDNVDPPYAYLDFLNQCTKDFDAHLLKA
ncbi:hypothetical protein RIF29_38722 [Crotalaria pallida]|uniref:Bet v I/Major latex protein domain-containing protein n=1 Tax=Crotalaria pallida TaxID=3830 RepID=A0AAN9E0D3_CROPI